jgi:membrane protease YdiL (CAAX protease family)
MKLKKVLKKPVKAEKQHDVVKTLSARQDQFYKHDPVSSAVLIILVFFVSQIGAGILISLYPSLRNWTGEQGNTWLQHSVIAQFVYILLAEVFAVWFVLWLLKRARITRQKIGLIRPVLNDILYALSGYAVYFVIYLAIVFVAGHFINTNQPQQIGFDGARGKQLYYVFASLVILPPIAEEIMFRGFLFTSLRQKFKLWHAVVLTSVLFGVAHLQFGSGAPLLWVAALDTFTLSCVLCTLREKTGSLWPGIYLHAIKNAVSFVYIFHSRF